MPSHTVALALADAPVRSAEGRLPPHGDRRRAARFARRPATSTRKSRGGDPQHQSPPCPRHVDRVAAGAARGGRDRTDHRVAGDGFDWLEAGIGAGLTAALLLAAARVASLRRRPTLRRTSSGHPDEQSGGFMHTAMTPIRRRGIGISLAVAALAATAVPARADTVTDWNDAASTTIVGVAKQPPPVAVMSFAMVQGAVYDAV